MTARSCGSSGLIWTPGSWSMASSSRVRRGPRRGRRSRRCWPTSCSMIWTGSCGGAVTGSCAMPTTSVSSCEQTGPLRVLDSVTVVVESRLKLKVNREKSKVVPASVATLLGFGLLHQSRVRIRVDPKALKRWKVRIRELTSRRWSVAMSARIGRLNRFVLGWMGYFRLADTPRVFAGLDEWFRRRMRQIRWKEWKRPRSRYRMLRSLGIPGRSAREWALSGKGYWRIGGSVVLQRALPNAYWEDLGLRMLKPAWQRLRSA